MARAQSALQQAGGHGPALAETRVEGSELGHLLTDLAADVASYAATASTSRTDAWTRSMNAAPS